MLLAYGVHLPLTRDYRALVVQATGPRDPSVFHLVVDGAEASLCGIAESSLGPGDAVGQRVCPECVDWLRRRKDSGEFKRVVRI